MIKIINRTADIVIADKARIARSFVSRLLGLMFRSRMEQGEALVFYHAPSIHMFFMRFAIDVVFLDRSMKVVKVVSRLEPWRMVNCFGSFCTLELQSGAAEGRVSAGDILEFVPA